MYVIFRRKDSFYVFCADYRSLRRAGRYDYLPIAFYARSVAFFRGSLSYGSEGLFGDARVSGIYGSYLVVFLFRRFLGSSFGLDLGYCVAFGFFQVSSLGGGVVFTMVFVCRHICVAFDCVFCVVDSLVCEVDVGFPSRFSLYFCLVAFYGDCISRIVNCAACTSVTTLRSAGYYARPKDGSFLGVFVYPISSGGFSFSSRSYGGVAVFAATVDELIFVRGVRVGNVVEGLLVGLYVGVTGQFSMFFRAGSP